MRVLMIEGALFVYGIWGTWEVSVCSLDVAVSLKLL